MGKQDEAIGHIWEMLRLNPGDNQGVRYRLLNWLLEQGNTVETGRLLKQYPDEISASWLYGRALHAFRTGGGSKRATKLLSDAQEWNRFVPPYLLGTKRLPRELPEYYSIGDESEAIFCAASHSPRRGATPPARSTGSATTRHSRKRATP